MWLEIVDNSLKIVSFSFLKLYDNLINLIHSVKNLKKVTNKGIVCTTEFKTTHTHAHV